jgi:gluconokinase
VARENQRAECRLADEMILIVAGVSGSGKTTVGTLVAARLHWPFADADSFHSPANVAKMHAGIPLTDEDRWPWLLVIAEWMDDYIARGESAVLTCSGLKRSYRDLLLDGRPDARMVFLSVAEGEIDRRLSGRQHHFFPEQLAGSQFDLLEPPQPDERGVTVLPESGTLTDTVTAVVGLVPACALDGDHEAQA